MRMLMMGTCILYNPTNIDIGRERGGGAVAVAKLVVVSVEAVKCNGREGELVIGEAGVQTKEVNDRDIPMGVNTNDLAGHLA